MQIVEDQDGGSALCELPDVAARRFSDLLDQGAALIGGQRGQALGALDGQHGLEERDASAAAGAAACSFSLTVAGGSSSAGADGAADDLPPGEIADGLAVGKRTALEPLDAGPGRRAIHLRSSATRRDLPMPASPTTATNAPWPRAQRLHTLLQERRTRRRARPAAHPGLRRRGRRPAPARAPGPHRR